MGKIAMINSLVVSLFTFQLGALPNPTESFFKEFKNLILTFLWDKKVPKIRYNKLIQGYQQRGLKLVDLQARNLALKAKWPLYFKDREEARLYKGLPVDNYTLWWCNIESKDIEKVVKKPGNINVDIWEAWATINYEYPETIQQFCAQPLWGNSLIK